MAYKISQSPHCQKLFIAPGNAGTTACGTNVSLDPMDFEAVKRFVADNHVGMVVVGPEAPLVAGIADSFDADPLLRNTRVVGPSQKGAELEGSKDFAKAFMERHQIPTAAYRTFEPATVAEGERFLESLEAPYVLKADGLAAGKGVLIISDLDEAKRELHNMLEGGKFGQAGAKVVIEQYLSGIEMSVFVLTDGRNYKILPSAKDYKRIGEGDTGLNTGGMGSVSPVPFADKEFMKKVEKLIVRPTVRGLQKEKISYRGFIFIGLMCCNMDSPEGPDPYVIEYNARMGDPETESVFPRIKSDVVELLEHTADGTLDEAVLDIDPRYAACVMMVAKGYPEKYAKGRPISGLNSVEGSLVFHAGTKVGEDGQVLTAGGRVACVTTLSESLPEALLKCYNAIDCISWQGKTYRRDIGQDLLKLMIG